MLINAEEARARTEEVWSSLDKIISDAIIKAINEGREDTTFIMPRDSSISVYLCVERLKKVGFNASPSARGGIFISWPPKKEDGAK